MHGEQREHICTMKGSERFGGFLSLEAEIKVSEVAPLGSGLFSSGRASLAAILKVMRPARLFLPGFLCDSAYRPAMELGIAVIPYPVGPDLRPPVLYPRTDDMVLFVDYFCMLTEELHALASPLGDRAIIDRSQCWFSPIPENCWSFDSARKFFGVPDGSRLRGPIKVEPSSERNTRYTLDHLVLGMMGEMEDALSAYRLNNKYMHTGPERISLVGEHLLERIDMDRTRCVRNTNFSILHEQFAALNQLSMNANAIDAPLYYPLLLKEPVELKALHEYGVFAPRLWPDVLDRSDAHRSDVDLVGRLIPLPIDQRYSRADMKLMATRVDKVIRVMYP